MSLWTCCELEAMCWIAAEISSTRTPMSWTDSPSLRNASRACSTVATPSSVWRAPSSTTSTALAVSVWISPMRLEIEPGGRLALLGQLADLLGDDREAAALLAGAGGLDGRVQRQQVRLLGDAGDRLDDAADALGLRAQLADRLGRL